MRTAEFQRGYNAGYKQALLDALRQNGNPERPKFSGARSPLYNGT